MTPKDTQELPRGPQEAPTSPQEAPRSRPDGPKSRPGAAQRHSRSSQEPPRWSQEAPRSRPEGFKRSPGALQEALGRARSAKRRDHITVLWTELVHTSSQHHEGPVPLYVYDEDGDGQQVK